MDATAIPNEVILPHVYIGIDTPIVDPMMSIIPSLAEVFGFSTIKEIGEEVVAEVSTLKAIVRELKVCCNDSKLVQLCHTYR